MSQVSEGSQWSWPSSYAATWRRVPERGETTYFARAADVRAENQRATGGATRVSA